MYNLIELRTLIPDIAIDLVYATERNFTRRAIYSSNQCFLIKETAARLFRVQKKLLQKGFGLKIWDAYRPLSVQRIFWEVCPDPRYVADPAIGSRHNRGAAVDLTLIDALGCELLMPTCFDDFTEKAHRNYQGAPAEVLQNRSTLQEAMEGEGFLPYPEEWWHFDDPDWQKFPILDIPFEKLV